MTETAIHAELSVPLEVRVLAGTLQGSRSVVDASQLVHVSGETTSDIVLPADDLAGCALAFRACDAGVRLFVLSGDVWAAGRRLARGQEVELPLYLPLHLGDTAIALGKPDSPAWNGVSADRQPTPSTANTAAAAASLPDTPTPAPNPQPSTARRWSRWLVMGGGALAAVSAAALAFAYSAVPAPVAPEALAQRMQTALHEAGFAQLVVGPGLGLGSGLGLGRGQELVVSGYLDTLAERAKVEQIMARQPLPSRLSAWVNESVVAAVTDIFRVNGIAAVAHATGPGAVDVSTKVADAARLEQIKAAARQDVPGLTALDVHNTPPAPQAEPMPAIDDPGKRVASIVPGDPAYVVTADGTRYFEGALLPTGQRIDGIRAHEVLLERAGTRSSLRF